MKSLSFTTISQKSEEVMWGPSPLSAPHQPKKVKKIKDIYTNTFKQSKLNSDIVQSYIEHMWMEIGKEQVDMEYVDCLLFSMFLNGFDNVLHWILKKGVFSKTYTFVPIVDRGHWNLLILCNFGKPLHKDCGPCMILLDSLHMADPLSKEPNIRRFVRELYKASGRIETGRAINSIPLLLPKVPQQNGGEECGVFMLYYMFLFAMNAPKSFSRTSYPYFLSEHWFSYDDVDVFEKKIRTFEKDMKQKQQNRRVK
ncbi:hypothetical protein Taro_050442, partial [Colocasia esculenta]|nr:hypothetical protein [Colocasia esculenta]